MSWSSKKVCGFAGIAWMQAGMRGYPRIVENEAGFRPGSRGPFLSGKGPKTIFVRARPRRGSFVIGQIIVASNSLRSNRLARVPYLARDSAAPKAGILSSVVIPERVSGKPFFS